MAINVEIQVLNGKVTITIGGRSSSKADDDKTASKGKKDQPVPDAAKDPVIEQGKLEDKGREGGSPGGLDDADTGGGGLSGGTLVIGPIVVGCPTTGDTGGGGLDDADTGGGGLDDADTGGGGLDDADTGGGGFGGGTVVIGPIIIGANGFVRPPVKVSSPKPPVPGEDPLPPA